MHYRDRESKLFTNPNPPTKRPLFQDFERGRAFLFLEEIARQFVAEYGLTVATAIAYGMNSEFSQVLAIEMRRFNEVGNSSIMNQVNVQIDELKNIMVRNIDNVTARGERLDLLINKTENLRNSVSKGRTVRGSPRAEHNPWFPIAECLLQTDVPECGPNDVLAERKDVRDPRRHSVVHRLRYRQHELRRPLMAHLQAQRHVMHTLIGWSLLIR